MSLLRKSHFAGRSTGRLRADLQNARSEDRNVSIDLPKQREKRHPVAVKAFASLILTRSDTVSQSSLTLSGPTCACAKQVVRQRLMKVKRNIEGIQQSKRSTAEETLGHHVSACRFIAEACAPFQQQLPSAGSPCGGSYMRSSRLSVLRSDTLWASQAQRSRDLTQPVSQRS